MQGLQAEHVTDMSEMAKTPRSSLHSISICGSAMRVCDGCEGTKTNGNVVFVSSSLSTVVTIELSNAPMYGTRKSFR